MRRITKAVVGLISSSALLASGVAAVAPLPATAADPTTLEFEFTGGPQSWIVPEGVTVRPGAPFVTRPAPGIGPNLGGAPEVVVNPGDVFDLWFYMP